MEPPASAHSSLASAISYGEHVFSFVLEKAEAFPKTGALCPSSWSDAQALSQQREDERRRTRDRSGKMGSRGSMQQDGSAGHSAPGSDIGDLQEQSVFWLFMEVRRRAGRASTTPSLSLSL
jgi:hypothetical protein